MYSNNPFAQAGWYNPENPLSINPQPWSLAPNSQPSMLGALPTMGSSSGEQRVLTFRMTPAVPDVLNASVLGPKGQTVCIISTDYNAAPIRTIFQKADGALMGYIEWSTHGSTVTITGGVHKKPTSQWLALSADKSYRTMYQKERPFAWVPRDKEISLYPVGTTSRDPIAKLFRGKDAIVLQMASEVIQYGVMESAIIATVLLQSGRKID